MSASRAAISRARWASPASSPANSAPVSGSGSGSQRQGSRSAPGRMPGSTAETPSSSKARSSRRTRSCSAGLSKPESAPSTLRQCARMPPRPSTISSTASDSPPALMRPPSSGRHHAKARRSSVRGCSGDAPPAGSGIGPGVCPMAKKRERRRASASFALTGNVL